MASEISNRAEIDPRAKIGNNCKIYPFAYIEGDVVIGDDCVIYPFVSIMNGTRMGNGNTIYQNTVIGATPQDFDFEGAATETIIGNNNNIRENVVINRATNAGGQTVIGNENFIKPGTNFRKDVPPFVVAGGTPVGYNGLNSVILDALGVTEKAQKHIANAYRLLFHGQTSVEDGIYQIKQQVPPGEEIDEIIEFLGGTKNGLMTKL